MTRSQKSAKKECDRLFSLITRSVGYCERCGRTDGSLQTSHFKGRRYSATRMEPDNVFCLCGGCHMELEQNPDLHHEFMVQMRGQETVDRLNELIAQPTKKDWNAELETLRQLAGKL